MTGGKPYWVVVSLAQAQEGNDGAWVVSTTDQVDGGPYAYNPNQTGWKASQNPYPPAAGVYSK